MDFDLVERQIASKPVHAQPTALVVRATSGQASAASTAELTDCLRAVGWQIDTTDADHLPAADAGPWEVVVIVTQRVTEATLLLAARASRQAATRVACYSPDRDPHHIADILRAGVDDYLSPPLAPEECIARLSSLAQHARSIRADHGAAPGGRRDGTATNRVRLDPATRTVRDGAARVALSNREWDVLSALLATGERLVSAAELASSIWGADTEQARVVSTISRLRRKLADAGVRAVGVETVRGLGYTARLAG